MGDGVRIDVKAIPKGQYIADHRVDAAEQRLVLQLLITEPNQRLERDLVAEPMIVAQLEDLSIDEALDQPKDIGVGAPLDLAHEPLLIARKGRKRMGQRKPIREELVSGIEAALPDHVFLDAPSHTLRRFDAARIAVAREDFADRIHFGLLRRAVCGWNERSGRLMGPCVSWHWVEGL